MGLRIGFAYNEKPGEGAEPPSSALREGVAEEAEPPSAPAQTWVAEDSEPPSRPPHSPSHDRYAEWDEPQTIAAVEAALRRVGSVIRLEADADFPRKLRNTNPDIVFNIAEGLNGPNREAHVPAICEFYGIPYSGSDVLTLALALDKRRAKEVFAARGVPTAPFLALRPDGPSLPAGFPLPAIVKPVHEGSSMGIPERAFCRTPEEVHRRIAEIADTYRQPALVEAFLPGREFTVAVLGNGPEASTLPIVEIRFDALPAGALPLYGYEAKWVWDTAEEPLEIFDCPAKLSPALASAIGAAALGAYDALGCRDWARVDLRVDREGRPNVIEINPLPGILPDPRQNSCFPKAARAAGIAYDDLICTVLELALRRCGVSR